MRGTRLPTPTRISEYPVTAVMMSYRKSALIYHTYLQSADPEKIKTL